MLKNNKQLPTIQFYWASPSGPKPMNLERLKSYVPIDRPNGVSESTYQITYRSYLESIKSVLSRKRDQFMEAIIESQPNDSFQIEEIRIITEKHGSDYHPARISVLTEQSTVSFVMNVALTNRGRESLTREFDVLRYLDDKFPVRFVPKVYFLSEIAQLESVDGEIPIRMFLGEWFEGFHEFHIADVGEKKSRSVVLWDMDLGYREMSVSESQEIYRLAALILTYYYNANDFSEIFPWHHAAGDFVASMSGDQIRVKLITARQYAPRVSFSEDLSENRLDGLMLFFASLTIRNRLDRLDGVREIVWADNRCLRATVEGFWAGLQMKVESGLCSDEALLQCRNMLSSISPEELTQVFVAVVSSFDPASPDMPMIRENLADHVLHVFKTINEMFQDL